jgi:hypothetical protein
VSADTPAISSAETVTVAALALGGSALVSLALDRDFNGDLLHYHFYNGYAFLAGRLNRDIAPAGIVSYFNPLLDAGHYAGIRFLRPRVFGGILGAFQGVNLLLVWALARRTLGRAGLWLAPLAAVLAALGQNALSLLGTTFADTTVSVPVLGAVLLLAGASPLASSRVLAASFLGGAAVGLKPTAGAAEVGLAGLVLQGAWRERRGGPLLAFVGGTLSGWAVTDGWWALAMWRRFGNPFYPLFNNVFRSPFSSSLFRLDPRWGVREPLDWLRPPIDAALGFHQRLQEAPFRDARLLLPFIALLLWLAASLPRARSGAGLRVPGHGLVQFWLLTYATWLGAFHYYRYGAVLEFLAPVVAFLLLQDACPRWVNAAAGLVSLALLLSTSVGQWGRRPWDDPWLRPRIPPLGRQPGQVVFLRDGLSSYTIPFFPPDSRFVGLPWARGPAAEQAIQSLVHRHGGPFLMLVRWPGEDDAGVRVFGLRRAGPCERARFGSGERFTLCPLARADSGGPEEGAGPAIIDPARSLRRGS